MVSIYQGLWKPLTSTTLSERLSEGTEGVRRVDDKVVEGGPFKRKRGLKTALRP